MALQLPSSISVKQLLVCDEWYNAEQIMQDEYLYYGGKPFVDYIENGCGKSEQKFLLKRLAEKENDGSFNGDDLWKERKKLAYYCERGPAIMKSFKYSVVKSKPTIVSEEDKTGYWNALNDNCNGLGGNLSSEVEAFLEQIILHGKGYLTLIFDSDIASPTNEESKNAWIRVLPTKYVDRCGHDSNGKLIWIRTFKKTCEYANAYSEEVREQYLWTYIDEEKIVEYKFSKKSDEQFKEGDVAVGIEKPHAFGMLPVFESNATNDVFLMEHLRAPMLALFNCETDIRWLLRCCAYPTFCLHLESGDVSKHIGHELQGLRLGINEKAVYVSPSADAVNMLFQQKEELIKSLNDVINSFPINVSVTQTQNPRAASSAKIIDRSAMISFLTSTALFLKDTLRNLIEANKEFRGEPELEVEIEGLEGYEDVLVPTKPGEEAGQEETESEDEKLDDEDKTATKTQQKDNLRYNTNEVKKLRDKAETIPTFTP